MSDERATVYVQLLSNNSLKYFKTAYDSNGLDIPFNLGKDLTLPKVLYKDNTIVMHLGFKTYSPIDLLLIPRSGSSLVEKHMFGSVDAVDVDLKETSVDVYNNSCIKLANTVGYIDHDYRGEWQARIQIESNDSSFTLKAGKCYLQMVPHNYTGGVDYKIVTSPSDVPEHLRVTERGEGGFNSSD